ncbi:MAG: homogentisate 1,2-dioxygenase [Acidobacteria bacterium]|nr:homogentisate 1,2-dioxygenase [Acidobacteriota bacterium]
MPFYHSLGSLPRKRHIAFRSPGGRLYAEELMGNHGFSGSSSLLYHVHPPTVVRTTREVMRVPRVAADSRELRHRHFRTAQVPAGGSPTLHRTLLLFNDEVSMAVVHADHVDKHFFRNAQADEILYVTKGAGTLETPFGHIAFTDGDYLVIPRGIIYRLVFDPAAGPLTLLVIESRGMVRTPRRYRTEFGQMKEGAPFSERDIRRPQFVEPRDETGEFPILVKQYDALTELVMAHHPFDVVGWDGYFYPYAFSIHDFEPIVGRVHQPPPVHQTFEGDGFVVCSFCPRPYDFHPEAIVVPYNHSNVESDEVLYYVSKEFMSRKGIEFGSITHHPDGLPHGPHPGRVEAAMGATHTDELAVMLDSFRPMRVAVSALPFEDPSYAQSWLPEELK